MRWPGGSPGLEQQLAQQRRAERRRLGGLITTALPDASAGAALCATKFSGELNDVMPHTTPRGTRIVKAMRCALPGAAVDRHHLADEPLALLGGDRKVWMARATSFCASAIGKPASAVIVRGQLVAVLLDQVAGAPQQDVALLRIEPCCSKEALRRGDGGVDLLARRAIGVADHLAGELVGDVNVSAAVDPRAADQEPRACAGRRRDGWSVPRPCASDDAVARRRSRSSQRKPESSP